MTPLVMDTLPLTRESQLISSQWQLILTYHSYGNALVQFDPAAERRLRWKLDLYTVPTVAVLYLFCFIDRANIGTPLSSSTHLHSNILTYSLQVTLVLLAWERISTSKVTTTTRSSPSFTSHTSSSKSPPPSPASGWVPAGSSHSHLSSSVSSVSPRPFAKPRVLSAVSASCSESLRPACFPESLTTCPDGTSALS